MPHTVCGASGAPRQLDTPMKILTIDDQPDIRRLIRMTLEFDGYDVIEASSGQEGIQLALEKKPDLILLDVMMPDMDGIYVSQCIRADPTLSAIPIVMLTALARDTGLDKGLDAGASFYLTKPFGPIELLDTIKQLLSKQEEK